MTYALRGACSLAAHALAALMAPGHRTDRTRRAGIIRRPGPRTGPRPKRRISPQADRASRRAAAGLRDGLILFYPLAIWAAMIRHPGDQLAARHGPELLPGVAG